MTRKFLIVTSVLGLWGVLMAILTATFFLKKMSPVNQNFFNMALTIHLVHTLAILAITFMSRFLSRSNLNTIFYFFVFGIILFSGSLYISSTREITNIIIGLTDSLIPIGGLSLLAGWVVLLFTGVTYKHKKRAPSE